ncbi:MAG: iron ABC transporter permease [Hoeflea sp.]|uniref:ABC transporter permease n=1 Tax=Hoeflea sp. TaxID=1940281 RepID=UPI001DEBEFA1|nr:iron ABC transporter permease [Hoeflea sp.]MBU4529627.1 iron ABC transporter permease [Alphaproteobacteria bacterium]MBU4546746.1 iron ABC transporter permease [Alphaproteobacteria bacterium]MBU4551014.1 iron ABC transporter permease [Alphaproteobacteria bacterium]MBV1723956.1 iron ABC transporter permease [Hoeflea sp.]MBV1763233.1 iron ABC transporter permease [Hoeflea sp.]
MARAREAVSPSVVIAAAGLVVVVAVPFLFILLQAVFPHLGRGSLAAPFSALAGALGDPKLIGMTGNTLLLGLLVVVLSALIAVPLAVARALFRVPGAVIWDVLFLIPFMIPPYIAVLGWIMTLQPRGYLEQLAGFDLAAFLFSVPGIVFVMTLNTFPVVYFAVSRTVETVGSRYADVARVFGASPLRAFWRVTLPLSTPGLAASLLLVFAMSIEEYGTPAALGRRAGFDVLVTAIDLRVSDWPIDLPGAAILSLVLVILSFGAFLLQRWILTRRSYEATTGKPQDAAKRDLGVWKFPVLALFAAVAVAATGLPLLAILATALSRTISGGLTLANLDLSNFSAILGDTTGALKALGTSLSLGVAAALVTGLLGALSAYAVVKSKVRGRGVLDVLTILPNALPGIVVAVGLILAWNQPWLPVTPYNTALILLLAYCCILLPQPVRYATAAFHQIGDNLEAAARVFGASPLVAFRRILLPLIAPSLLAAMLLVFAVATRELVASVVVAPVGVSTISTYIWRQFEQGSVGLGMAMAFITILITTALPLIVLSLMGRRGNLL